MDEQTEKKILNFFEEYPQTAWGVICEGEYDVLWRILGKDERDVEKASSMIIEKFGEKIIEKTMTCSIHQRYLSWNRALDSNRQLSKEIENLDEIGNVEENDLKIISALYENSRISTIEISRIVKLTPKR